MSDPVTEYAKKTYQNNNTASEVSASYITKDMKHLDKKMSGRDDATRALMAGTYTAGLKVLSCLHGVDLTETVLSVYVYCKNEGYRYISKQFEAAIELAILKPEKFLYGLHGFFNTLASKIRNDPTSRQAFIQFLGRFMELRYRKCDDSNINPNVILVYTDLLLQFLDYLRPRKYDRDTSVCGITISGEQILIPNPFPWVNLAEWEHVSQSLLDAPNYDFYDLSVYRRYGFPDTSSMAAIKDHFRKTRIFQNTCAILCPFINEYTYDILPCGIQNGQLHRWSLMESGVDSQTIEAKLASERRCTLPANGMLVDFEDETLQLKTLLLKEILLDNTIYLLYKLSTSEGEYAGYFRPSDSFFYSVALEASEEIHHFFRDIVEYFYAVAVLGGEYTDENCTSLFRNFIFRISAKSHKMEGPLRDVYHVEPDSCMDGAATTGTQAIDSINGTIIKVGPDANITDSERQYAKALGFALAYDEVYRAPAIPTFFSLRDYTPSIDENAESQYSGQEGWLQDE